MNICMPPLAVLVAAALAVPHPVQAQEPDSTVPRTTLEQALGLFAENNLELRAARAEAAEAAALARQAAAFPNPEFGVAHEPLSDDDRSYSESSFGLSQRVEWPGTRNAREAVATRLAAAAAARVAADSARLAFMVKRSYVDAVRARQDASLLDRVTAVFREAERSAHERVRAGDISAYEARRIAVERLRYESALAEAQLDASAARRALALLAAPESAVEIAPADDFAHLPELDSVAYFETRSNRPELRAARAELDAARAEASLARRDRIPDVTAMGGYKRQSDGFSGLTLGLELPLPLWDRNAGTIDAADARVAASAARLALAERRVASDVARALEAFRSYERRSSLLAGPLSAETTDLLGIAQIAYEAGEMDLVALLDAADALREAQTLEARFRADLWTSYFDLERALGGFGVATDREDDE